MRKLMLFPVLLLMACGSEPPSTDGEAADAIELLTETNLVENPPTYPSEPLAEGLVWITNEADDTFASPDAVRGGTFNDWMLSFPLTLRLIGPDSNGTFAGVMRPNHMMSLVDIHPNTLNYIPSLATHWAFHPDGKTVSYRLNPAAEWSDGRPITADDYLFTRDFATSEFTLTPYYQDYFGDVVVKITKHDDYTISIEGAAAKPQDELPYEYSVWPTPRHFHRLDANWVQDYNWRVEPNPGPYQVSRVEKGQFIEFTRRQDWWGDRLKYKQNRFNPDTVRYTVIRDQNVAWEYFLRGEIDAFPVLMPNYWHDKAVGEPFDKGWIRRIKFYTDTPQASQGMWLNMDDPLLADRNIRYGLAHAMNVDRLLATVLRGDYERLRMHYDGYWDYSHPTIQPRAFDLNLAEQYFTAAGWTERGPDSIRVKDGRRLSFTVNYSTDEHTPRLVFLREEARKAGVELNLQLMDSSASFKQILEKNHQIAWMAWTTSLFPTFWQHYHSENAHIPQTNNITATDDPALDVLIDAHRTAVDRESRVRLAHEIEQMIHDIGMFIPMYKVPYTREAYWRWLELPADYATRTTETIFEPMAEGLFWINEQAREETLAARRAGSAFAPSYIEDTRWRVD
jgi:microcin C transport system substrate-binding protein